MFPCTHFLTVIFHRIATVEKWVLFVVREQANNAYCGSEQIFKLMTTCGVLITRSNQPTQEEISHILNTRSERQLMKSAFPTVVDFQRVCTNANGNSYEIKVNDAMEMPSVEFVGARLESARARQTEKLTKKAKQEGRL